MVRNSTLERKFGLMEDIESTFKHYADIPQ